MVRVRERRRRPSPAPAVGWADGLYAGWTAALRDAAEVIVRLDLPPRVTPWRVVKRAIEQRRRGGHDWDLRSVARVVRCRTTRQVRRATQWLIR